MTCGQVTNFAWLFYVVVAFKKIKIKITGTQITLAKRISFCRSTIYSVYWEKVASDYAFVTRDWLFSLLIPTLPSFTRKTLFWHQPIILKILIIRIQLTISNWKTSMEKNLKKINHENEVADVQRIQLEKKMVWENYSIFTIVVFSWTRLKKKVSTNQLILVPSLYILQKYNSFNCFSKILGRWFREKMWIKHKKYWFAQQLWELS